MTVDNENRVWVGGATDYYTGIASDPHSRAYLARLDNAGAPIWEKSYKTGNVPFVVSITPISTGSVLVAANDGWFQPSWLAMIAASDGAIVWEQHIGNGKGIAVARAADDVFLLLVSRQQELTGAMRKWLQFEKLQPAARLVLPPS